jgi:hypothetical protein
MGEIAEMMLDGTLCEGCGDYLGDGDEGYPQYCSPSCAKNRGATYSPLYPKPKKQKPKKQKPKKQKPKPKTNVKNNKGK